MLLNLLRRSRQGAPQSSYPPAKPWLLHPPSLPWEANHLCVLLLGPGTLPSVPPFLPPSDPLSHGTALCCRTIPTPWKYPAVKPLNQLEGTRSEVYLEKGSAVCEPALTHFSGTGGTGLSSIPPSLPSARGRLGRPTQTLRIRACSGEHVLSINKATERQKIISRNTKDLSFPPLKEFHLPFPNPDKS